MDRRILLGTALCAASLASPLVANAQSNGTENYYTPPKLLKPARPSVPVAGAGTVVVQVYVKTDGSFTVQKVLRSTNHGDDAAALDIAKHSTYAPATRGNKKVVAFYDYTLKFTAGGGSSSDAGSAAGGSDTAAFERELRAGNYSGAQAGLKAYLAQHPDDAKAQTDLGVADTFLNDYEGAVAAFDKAGTIADTYKAAAGKAYAEYAAAELKAKENDKAVASAKRAVEIQPGFFTYNTLGFAELQSGDSAAAISDLEKARGLGQSQNLSAHSRVQVDDNLLTAYVASGKTDQAKTIVAEIAQLDPQDTARRTSWPRRW